jgi:hypothetical protein
MKRTMMLMMILLFASFVVAQPQNTVTKNNLDLHSLASLPDNYADSTKALMSKGFMASILNDFDDCEKLVKYNVSSTCSDTDNGLNYNQQGTVSGYLNSTMGYVPYSFTDFCMNTVKGQEKSTKLIEFYCKDNECNYKHPWFKKVDCPDGCTDGACKINQIPEFTTISIGVALAGVIVGLILLKRK